MKHPGWSSSLVIDFTRRDNKPIVVLSSDVGDELRVALGLVLDKMECCFEIWNPNYKHKNWTKQLSVRPFCVNRLDFGRMVGFFVKTLAHHADDAVRP